MFIYVTLKYHGKRDIVILLHINIGVGVTFNTDDFKVGKLCRSINK